MVEHEIRPPVRHGGRELQGATSGVSGGRASAVGNPHVPALAGPVQQLAADGRGTSRRRQARSVSGLPLARVDIATETLRAAYVTTSVDPWGRLGDRSLLRNLDWLPGSSVSVVPHPEFGLIVVRQGGPETITRQGHLRLPVHVRHGCHLKTGDRLLLAALVDTRLLLVFAKAALDALVLAQFTVEADLERPQ